VGRNIKFKLYFFLDKRTKILMYPKVLPYALITISMTLGFASAALLYQAVIHESGFLLALAFAGGSLGLYVLSFSRTQLMNSSPEMHTVLIGGSAAPSWISWLLSISSLRAGLMIANNKDIVPDTNFPLNLHYSCLSVYLVYWLRL